MQRRSRIRLLGAAVVLATAATGLATAAGQATAAQPATPAASAAGGAHFVVLGDEHRGLAQVERAVRDSGGTVLKSWPQIGVVVATSANADFATVVRRKNGVRGAGATRNLAELATTPPAARIAAGANAKSLEATEAVVTNGGKGKPTDPGDPLSVNQWNLGAIKADQAHARSGGSSNVVVGVLDSGIEATHPDLAANVDASRSVGCTNEGVPDTTPAAWAPTTSDHGTHVAGIIAAAKNGVGVVGVAPNVKLASVKVVDDEGFIYPEYAICGFVWAAEKGIHVTNNSYFIDPWFLWCRTDADQRAVITAVTRAVDYSARRGVVNVAALGNSNWDLSHDITDSGSPNNGTPTTRETGPECFNLPSEIDGVVGVSSTGVKNEKSYFSNYGITETDVAAPGGDRMQVPSTPDANGRILSTVVGGAWGYKQGTSMASPHAAGVVALIRSTHRHWPAPVVIGALHVGADKLPCPPGVYDPDGTGVWAATCEGGKSGRGFYGSGLIDALAAVR
ncbi:S8 family peptidase [Actinokineospora cianjurensis]|uniref:Subtilase family protein n=1 Tax=Actinokineospora cianjurensis TaxID=585224 RepID=A0A421B8S9_9PSEU|nr:S8 family serine peptidase [Actinokineospora cianjurensis]RLK60936.1 subtilase family protein [Actinokineospora cianjurensis]